MSLSVRAAAREAPERTALETPERSWTFRELCARVLDDAGRLSALRLPPRRPLAFQVGVEPDSVVRLLAAIELGRAALPLPRYLDEPTRRELIGSLGAVDLDCLELPVPAGRSGAAAVPPPPRDDGRPLAILRTSGSAGRPKAVELSRAAFAASAAANARRLGWRDGDRWLLTLPPAHVGGLSIVTRCLVARRTLVVPDAEQARRDPLGAVAQHRASLVSWVPTLLRRALDARPEGPMPATLRAVLVGGARAPAALLREALDRGLPVLPTYGLTEACSQVATAVPGEPVDPGGPVGPPLPGTRVRVREGRLEIRSPSLLTRYLPAGAWPSPLTEDGWLRTGDAARIDQRGRVEPLGRADRAITTGGVTVHPEEVEAALESWPEIGEALAVGLADDRWGERVGAVIVPAPGQPDGQRLLERLRPRIEELPGPLRPRSVALVREFPRTAAGKPDRGRIGWATLEWLEP